VAAAEAGPAVVTDALAIILGFGLLVASQVPTNRWLGLLVVFGLASACLLTLAGAGSVLELLDRRRSRTVPAESPRPIVTGMREEA
jgi:predicted RND superfamily exporter protein